MILIRSLDEMAAFRNAHRDQIAFVPTMGNLHEGHLKLVERAKTCGEAVLVSIFVNPTQFNDAADFAKYPRTLAEDLEKLETAGATAVFLPTETMIYSDRFRFQVSETDFSRELCGAHRPGHFTGVLTVVLKLIQLSGARWLIMGLKDYQQYRLIKDMCAAFFMDVSVIGVETVRESNGLAMSSRNNRLSPEGRAHASSLHEVLSDAKLRDDECRAKLETLGFSVDYVETKFGRRFGAAFLEGVRLIDNVVIRRSETPEQESTHDSNP